MKRHRLLLALAAVGLLGSLVGEVRADGRGAVSPGLPRLGGSFSGGPFFGGSLFNFGRSPTSLYGLGRMFVPPHFAIHPPVYYSLPQGRPYGHSPFAYRGDYQPQVTARRMVLNPHIQSERLPEPDEAPLETSTTTARLIKNPYYSADDGPEAALASQVD